VFISVQCSLQFVLEYVATLHDERYSPKVGNVGDGITSNRNKVREFAHFHRASAGAVD
jgi:hypothetical protein